MFTAKRGASTPTLLTAGGGAACFLISLVVTLTAAFTRGRTLTAGLPALLHISLPFIYLAVLIISRKGFPYGFFYNAFFFAVFIWQLVYIVFLSGLEQLRSDLVASVTGSWTAEELLQYGGLLLLIGSCILHVFQLFPKKPSGLTVGFPILEPDIPLPYVVIAVRHDGRWVWVRHKDRKTFEIPGGHIEPGETPVAAARRELFEETGALEPEITFVGYYTVSPRTGPPDGGRLYYAKVDIFGPLPEYEIAERTALTGLPEAMTWPEIQPALLKRAENWELENRGE
ncbi:MAG: NUDIX domain-containing protein [Oscillospiraceae bacterium]|nr:NUDIX domain-containing protein [Oscillospiraceae bacterium]